VAGAAGLFLVLTLAGAGAFLYARRADATRASAAESHAPIVLPPGRKDLPPLGGPSATGATPAELPSTLPDVRGPTRDGSNGTSSGEPRVAEPNTGEPKAATRTAKPKAAPSPKAPAPTAPAPPAPPPDDLSNIGRR
jgi:hypothetical protein